MLTLSELKYITNDNENHTVEDSSGCVFNDLNIACQNEACEICSPEPFHKPVTTLEELDALDENELIEGYTMTKRGDPEPGANHSRSYHHGWRTRMMDYGEIKIPWEHHELVRQLVARKKN